MVVDEQQKLLAQAYQRGYRAGYIDGVAAGDTQPPEILQLPVEALGLSARPLNCLRSYGCQQIADVAALSPETIRRMRNLGKISADQIARALQSQTIFGTAWDAWLLD